MEPQDNNEDITIGKKPAAKSPVSHWEELQTRVISGVVMAAVLLTVLWTGGWLFNVFVLIIAMIMIKEWNNLTRDDGPGWHIAGMFYTALPCASLIWLRDVNIEGSQAGGLQLVLYLFFVIWATDIGAYFVGKQFGKVKLAPTISPGKTWEGLAGGVAAASIVSGLCYSFTPFPTSFIACIFTGSLLAMLGQASDLFESWMKRRVGMKDSGSLIPGHGGILDRVDGLTLTAPVFAAMLVISMIAGS